MITISQILGREILDSRGNPTVEVEIHLNNGIKTKASVPSGASTGSREALELRDQDLTRFRGLGVLKAVNTINKEIRDVLIGKNIHEPSYIDEILLKLDQTENKSLLGANAILGVSIACWRAASIVAQYHLLCQYFQKDVSQILMPTPMANILNGGAHADNNLDIQEFMIIPISATSIKHAIMNISHVFHALRFILKEKQYFTGVGDEGGFAPNLKSNQEALDLILMAIEKAGYSPGKDFVIALDIASSEFYSENNNTYTLKKSSQEILNSQELIEMYKNLIQRYPIVSIEDGMAENDLEGWKLLTQTLGNKIQLVGDDLFVTNSKILQEGIHNQIANSILVKPNQIGTVTETIQTIQLAQQFSYTTIASHRSGETEDSFISELAVGLHMGQIKTGSISRMDRVAKYNQLLRIEEYFCTRAIYQPPKQFFI